MEISIRNITVRVKEVILYPKTFWRSQKHLKGNQSTLLFGYFFPLVIFVSLGEFLGEFTGSQHLYMGYAALKLLRVIILYTLQYFVSVFLTNELVEPFGGQKNLIQVQKLIIYSLTPFLLVSFISGLFPFFYVIDIFGFYGFYIFWIGVHEMMDFPDRTINRYIIAAVLVNILIFEFLSFLLSRLLMSYI